MDTQDMEKEKQQLTTQTSQKGLESRLENTWSLIPGLGAVWTACVHYLSNSLVQLLLASLLLMRAIWSNCASNCCFTCRGKRRIYVFSKTRLILCPQHLSFLPAVSFHSSPLSHLNFWTCWKTSWRYKFKGNWICWNAVLTLNQKASSVPEAGGL